MPFTQRDARRENRHDGSALAVQAARGLVVVLAVVNLASFGVAVHRRFATARESRALAAGVSHWLAGDFGLADDSPPLARMLATLPVLTLRPTIGELQRRDECVDPAVWSRLEDRIAGDLAGSMLPDAYVDTVRIARLAGYSWWLLGAWLAFRWTRESYGEGAGWLALALWSIAPGVPVAEATIDPALPAAVSAALATYAFVLYLRRPSVSKALGIGLLLGVALLVDYVLIALIVTLVLLWVVCRVVGYGGGGRSSKVAIGMGRSAFMVAACLWVIHLGYGMQPDWRRLKDYEFVSRVLAGTPPSGSSTPRRSDLGNRFRDNPLGNLVVPLPLDYVCGLDRRLWEVEADARSADGGRRDSPRDTAASVAARVPLGTLAMLVWVLSLTALRRNPNRPILDDLILWVPVGLVLAAMVFRPRLVPIDQGLVLAAPFATVGVGRLGQYFTPGRWRAGAAVFLLTSWAVISSLVGGWGGRPYLNEAVGGPGRLRARMAYGPGDGGPDLLELKAWADTHPEARPLGIAVRHAVDLKPFGLTGDLTPAGAGDATPNGLSLGRRIGLRPGYYALDIGNLRSQDFSHLRSLRPAAHVGSAIVIYQVTTEVARRVRRDLGLPPVEVPPRPPVVGRGFLRHDYRDGSGDDSHYTVFVPHSYTGDRPYPLILFLHGAGDAGTDGDQYLKVGLPPAIEARKESFDFITVIPQGRHGNWSPGTRDAGRALAVLKCVEAEYLVDPKRVYLTGLSSGGAGVWALAERYPERWAAIVPVASAGCDPASAPRIKDIPCWCFHNVNDVGSPPDAPRAMIAAVRRAGGAPRYSEFFYPATTAAERHNAWDAAYGDMELYDWLLAHRLP